MVSRREGSGIRGFLLAEYVCAPAVFTPEEPMLDLLTGRRVSGELLLEPYGVKVLQAVRESGTAGGYIFG